METLTIREKLHAIIDASDERELVEIYHYTKETVYTTVVWCHLRFI